MLNVSFSLSEDLRKRAKDCLAGLIITYLLVGVCVLITQSGGPWLLALFVVWLLAGGYLLIAGQTQKWTRMQTVLVGAAAPLMVLTLIALMVAYGAYKPRKLELR